MDDTNILHSFSMVKKVLNGEMISYFEYKVNNKLYKLLYYLVDVINPN